MRSGSVSEPNADNVDFRFASFCSIKPGSSSQCSYHPMAGKARSGAASSKAAPKKDAKFPHYAKKGMFNKAKRAKRRESIAAEAGRVPATPTAANTDPILYKSICRMLKALTKDEQQRLRRHLHTFLGGRLSISSSRSGSGMARVVAEYIAEAFAIEIDSCFLCELEPWKQDWIRDVIEVAVGDRSGAGGDASDSGSTPCTFPNILGLGAEYSKCTAHEVQNKKCKIRKSRLKAHNADDGS